MNRRIFQYSACLADEGAARSGGRRGAALRGVSSVASKHIHPCTRQSCRVGGRSFGHPLLLDDRALATLGFSLNAAESEAAAVADTWE